MDWLKPVIISTPNQWRDYIIKADAQILSQFKIVIVRHFGMPVTYPCMVYSIIDHKERYVENKFIYVEDALALIKQFRTMESRLVRVMMDQT